MNDQNEAALNHWMKITKELNPTDRQKREDFLKFLDQGNKSQTYNAFLAGYDYRDKKASDYSDIVVQVTTWDPTSNSEKQDVTNLEDVIANPSGRKLEDIGLAFLNIERKKRGLSQYKYNTATGTYDEVAHEANKNSL